MSQIDATPLDLGLGDANEVDIYALLNDEAPQATAKPEDVKPIETATDKEEEDIEPHDTDTLTSLINEDKEKEVEDKKEEEPAPAINEDVEDEFSYEDFAKDLVGLGILTESEEMPKTAEELAAAFKKEKEQGANQYLQGVLGKHGQDRIDLFKAVFEDGVDPREYLSVYAEMLDLKDLDLKDKDTQTQVVFEYYKRKGKKEDWISKRLEKVNEYNDLEEEANLAYEELMKTNQAELQRQEIVKKQQADIQERTEEAYKEGVKQILDARIKEKNVGGIPLTEKVKNQAFDFLNTKKYILPTGETLTEFDKFILDTKRPENYEARVKIALLALNNFDLTQVKEKAISTESNKIFDSVARKYKRQTINKNEPSTLSGWLKN